MLYHITEEKTQFCYLLMLKVINPDVISNEYMDIFVRDNQ